MGKYDNEYKHYYRRVSDNKENIIKDIDNYEEELGNRYGKKYSEAGGQGRGTEYFIKGIVGTTVFSLFLFGGVIGSKYFLGESGEKFYNNVKIAIEETGGHKEKISEFSEKIKNEAKNLIAKNSVSKVKVETDKVEKETIKDNDENIARNKELTVSSFKLNESSVESTKLGDLKYKSEIPVKKYKSIEKGEGYTIFKEAEGDILSLLDGEVVSLSEKDGKKIIEINYGDNLTGFYYNLGKVTVKKGDKVTKGAVIANVEEKSDIKIRIKEKEKFLNLEEYLELNNSKN